MAEAAAKAEEPKKEKIEKKEKKSKLEESIERAKEQHRKEMYQRRLEIARQGFSDYENHRFVDATKAFHNYLKILEEWKEVKEGTLVPNMFDKEKDAKELVLLSGVYWDLAKLYDRTRGKKRYLEFRHYIDKFVQFSQSCEQEPTCAESLRKYISNDKAVHKKEFADAYKRMRGGKDCFVASVLTENLHPQTIPLLRRYRDEVLSSSFLGNEIRKLYYRLGPSLAVWIEARSPRFKTRLSRALDWFAQRVSF